MQLELVQNFVEESGKVGEAFNFSFNSGLEMSDSDKEADKGRDSNANANAPAEPSSTETQSNITCIVLGDEAIGKSTLVQHFVSPLKKIDSTSYKPTALDEFCSKS